MFRYYFSIAGLPRPLFLCICLACCPAPGLAAEAGTVSPPGGLGHIISPPIESAADAVPQPLDPEPAGIDTVTGESTEAASGESAEQVEAIEAVEPAAVPDLPPVETAVPALIRDGDGPETIRREISADPEATADDEETVETAPVESPETGDTSADTPAMDETLAAAEQALAEGKQEQALTLFHSAAQAGNPAAQIRLGDLYLEGEVTTQSAERAMLWYRRAARTGDAEAQFQLGKLYSQGQGVLLDETAARDWFAMAADQGHAGARGQLEELERRIKARRSRPAQPAASAMREEVTTAMETESDPATVTTDDAIALAPLPEAGETETSTRVAAVEDAAGGQAARSLYEEGQRLALGNGVDRDAAAAVNLYREAAELGHAPAQYRLGAAYHFGEGIDRDFGQAAEWYQRAAEQGYTMAQRNLSGLYLRGEGVEPDRIQALAWMNLVAARGGELDQEQQRRLAAELTEDEQQQARELAGKLVIHDE